MTVEIPPPPTHAPDQPAAEPVSGFWLGPRTPVDPGEAISELAAEIRQARLDDAIPIKADDADDLIDWQRVRAATRRLIRAMQLWPNLSAASASLIGPAWLWRYVVVSCSTSFAPAADVADPGLCLGLMTLAGAVVVHQIVRGKKLLRLLSPLTRTAVWAVVFGTVTYPPAAAWLAALIGGIFK
ncbi:hypothetical protein [Kitasatospora sp. NPDC004272]